MTVGCVTVEKLVHDDPVGPHIGFDAVGAVDVALGGHVDWRTDVEVAEGHPESEGKVP